MPTSEMLLNEIENPYLRAILALLDGKQFPDLTLEQRQIVLLNRKIKQADLLNIQEQRLDLALIIKGFYEENNPTNHIEWEKVINELFSKTIAKKLYKDFLTRLKEELQELWIVLKEDEVYACQALENYLIQNQIDVTQHFLETSIAEITNAAHTNESIQKLFGEKLLKQFKDQLANTWYEPILERLENDSKLHDKNKIDLRLSLLLTVLKENKELVCAGIKDFISCQPDYTQAANLVETLLDKILNFAVDHRSAISNLFGYQFLIKLDEQKSADESFNLLLISDVLKRESALQKLLSTKQNIIVNNLKKMGSESVQQLVSNFLCLPASPGTLQQAIQLLFDAQWRDAAKDLIEVKHGESAAAGIGFYEAILILPQHLKQIFEKDIVNLMDWISTHLYSEYLPTTDELFNAVANIKLDANKDELANTIASVFKIAPKLQAELANSLKQLIESPFVIVRETKYSAFINHKDIKNQPNLQRILQHAFFKESIIEKIRSLKLPATVDASIEHLTEELAKADSYEKACKAIAKYITGAPTFSFAPPFQEATTTKEPIHQINLIGDARLTILAKMHPQLKASLIFDQAEIGELTFKDWNKKITDELNRMSAEKIYNNLLKLAVKKNFAALESALLTLHQQVIIFLKDLMSTDSALNAQTLLYQLLVPSTRLETLNNLLGKGRYLEIQAELTAEVISTDLLTLAIDKNVPRLREILTDSELRKEFSTGLIRYMEDKPVLDVNGLLQAISDPATRDQVINTVFGFTDIEVLGNELVSISFLERIKELYPELYQWLVVKPDYQAPATTVKNVLELKRPQLNTLIKHNIEKFFVILADTGATNLATRIKASEAWLLLLGNLLKVELPGVKQLEVQIKLLQANLAKAADRGAASIALRNFLIGITLEPQRTVEAILPADKNFHVELIAEAQLAISSSIYKDILKALEEVGLKQLRKQIDTIADVKDTLTKYFSIKIPPAKETLLAKAEQLKVELLLAEFFSPSNDIKTDAQLALVSFFDGLLPNKKTTAKLIFASADDHKATVNQATILMLSDSAPTTALKIFLEQNIDLITLNQDLLNTAKQVVNESEENIELIAVFRDYEDKTEVQRQHAQIALAAKLSAAIWQTFLSVAVTGLAKTEVSAWEDESALEDKLKANLKRVIHNLFGIKNNNIAVTDGITDKVWNAFTNGQKQYLKLVYQVKQAEGEQPNTLNHVVALFETKAACEGLQALQQKLDWAELCKQIEKTLVIEANSAKPFEVANAVLQQTLEAWLGIQSAEIVPAELWSAAAKQIEAALFNANACKRLENLFLELKANNLPAIASKIQNSAIRYALLNYFSTTALPHADILTLKISKLRQDLLARGTANVDAVMLSFINSLMFAESSRLVADHASSDEPLILEELDEVNTPENGSHSAALDEVQQLLDEQDKQIIGEVRYIKLLSILQEIGLSTVAKLIDKAKDVLIKALKNNDNLLEDLVDRAKALPEDLVKETNKPIDTERNGVRRALTHFFKGKEKKEYASWYPVADIINKILPLNPELNYTNHQRLMAQARYHVLLNDIPSEEVQAFVEVNQTQIIKYLKIHNVSTWTNLLNDAFECLVNGSLKLLGRDIAENDAIIVKLRHALSDAQKNYLTLLSNEQNEAVLALLRKSAVVKAVLKYFAADAGHSIVTFKHELSLKIVKHFDPNVNMPHWQAVEAALKELDDDLSQITLSQVELYAVFDLLPASVGSLLSCMWSERNHVPLLALLHIEAAAFQAYLTSNANSAEHLRAQFFKQLTDRAVFNPEQLPERDNVVRDALNVVLTNAGQSLANPAANVTDEVAQDLWNEWLTEGQRKLIVLVQEEKISNHNNIVAFLQAEAAALSTVLENKTASNFIKDLAADLIAHQNYNPTIANNYRSAVRAAMQAIVPELRNLNINLTDQAVTEIWDHWFTNGMRRYADLIQNEQLENHANMVSLLRKPEIAEYVQKELNSQTVEVFKNRLKLALVSQAFDISNPEQCRTVLIQAKMPAEVASNEEVLAIINQFLGQNIAHELAYNSIYHAVPIQLAVVRNWLNNNRSQACQALNPEILTPNFATEITTTFINATTQSDLETAIRKLFGQEPLQLQPEQISQLDYAAATKEGLLYNALFDNADIQAAFELKTALQTTHFAVSAANLQPANISYDALKLRLNDLLMTKTFNEAKNKLIAEWRLPENIANAMAPHVVALSTYKHGLEHVAERRVDLVAFLENLTNKQKLLGRAADQANSNVDSDMHAWMRQQLDTMQGENCAEDIINNAAAELLGPHYSLTLEEEKLRRHIYAANQPVTEIEQTVAPLFMRWLRSRPHLHNEMRLKTRHWSRDAWEYRVEDALKLLLEPQEGNVEAFTRHLAVATQVSVAFLTNVPTAIEVKRNLVDPDLTIDERKMLTGEARLIHWLKRTPFFAAALKKTATWEVWANALGGIDDAQAAKTELESRLSRYRNDNDLANLDISYHVAHTELCLAEFEKRNPALIRWFRSSPWWKKIIDTLQNYSAEQIHNILLGVSYLFARGEHKHLASLRAILNKPLDELVDRLFVNKAADEASNMFGGNVPSIVLLPELSARALFESLSDAEVAIIINSSRTALGLSKFLNSRIKNNANVNLDAVINKFKHAHKPKAFIESLQVQATSDQALFKKIESLDSNSKYLDRTQLRKDNTALALAINAYYQARVSFDYFKKKYEEIENYLAAVNDMVDQIETLDDAAITKELKSELEQARATQKTLRVYVAQYQIKTNKADRVLDRYDATIYGLSKVISQKSDKVLYPASSGRVLAGIVDDEPDFVITNEVVNQLQRQSHNRPNQANAELQIGAAAQQEALHPDEWVPGKRYVQVRYTQTNEEEEENIQSSFSVVHKDEGYIAQFHHVPEKPKLFEPLACWFKGVNTPYTDAIGELVKQAFVLSDVAWAKGADDTTLRFSFIDRKMLQEALTWAYTVNIIRRYNGEREVPISYDVSVNAPKLVDAAEKRAADLIAKKDAHVAPMRQDELSDKLAEAIATTNKAANHLGKRLAR